MTAAIVGLVLWLIFAFIGAPVLAGIGNLAAGVAAIEEVVWPFIAAIVLWIGAVFVFGYGLVRAILEAVTIIQLV